MYDFWNRYFRGAFSCDFARTVIGWCLGTNSQGIGSTLQDTQYVFMHSNPDREGRGFWIQGRGRPLQPGEILNGEELIDLGSLLKCFCLYPPLSGPVSLGFSVPGPFHRLRAGSNTCTTYLQICSVGVAGLCILRC